MEHEDRIRLQHMLDAAQEALGFVVDKGRWDLETDRMLALSLIKEIEIIGEAASRVTEETRIACPRIAWTHAVAMRNRLIHGYFDIDLDRVWATVQYDLPPLIEHLTVYLAVEEP
jgi:uncharacterized protein with HEPN domain